MLFAHPSGVAIAADKYVLPRWQSSRSRGRKFSQASWTKAVGVAPMQPFHRLGTKQNILAPAAMCLAPKTCTASLADLRFRAIATTLHVVTGSIGAVATPIAAARSARYEELPRDCAVMIKQRKQLAAAGRAALTRQCLPGLKAPAAESEYSWRHSLASVKMSPSDHQRSRNPAADTRSPLHTDDPTW